MNRLTMAALIVATTMASLGADDKKTGVLLQAAEAKATVQGDLKAAIALYGDAVKEAGANRTLAAKALVRMAECYQKLGDAEAQKIYERIVRDFADQKEAVAQARTRLGRGESGNGRSGIVTRQVWTGPKVDFDGTVTPDGRLLSYVDWPSGDLAIHDLMTGEDRRLTDQGSLSESNEYADQSAISPDGKQVVYTWFNKQRVCELRLMDLAGSGGKARTLVRREDVEWVGPHSWTPDGKWIAVHLDYSDGTAQIGLVAAADGFLRVLKTVGHHDNPTMAISPDGKYLAHNLPPEGKSDRDIYLMAIDGSRETPLVVHPADDFVIGWTPDGRHLLFASNRTGTMSVWSLAVSEGKAQGSPVLLKKDIGGPPDTMGVTRSGAMLYGIQTEGADVYSAAVDLETGRLLSPPAKTGEEFFGSNGSPDWSPDGKYLAYLSHRDNATVLAIRTLETGRTREVRLGLRDVGGTKWSPDGRSIAVRATGSGDRQGIFSIDVQSGESAPMVVGALGSTASTSRYAVGRPWWSPDGKTLYYARILAPRESAIVARELESGNEREVIRRKNMGSGENVNLSPDGREFAVTTFDAATKSTALVVVPTVGGQPREILRLPGRILCSAWSADSRSVLFSKGASGHDKLWRIPAAGGEPRQLEMSAANVSNFVVHPDGRRIAFQSAGGKQEVWALENFLPATPARK